ncbi:MAG: YwaF family protein [Corallococcus sp.]|nr:YwaF family protein [Corallococcus sp.]MCM1359074.1 YwaF family protein [Corallococcus sp.]MCM1395063.1 YwaF family protein [Corallococcus sp.]
MWWLSPILIAVCIAAIFCALYFPLRKKSDKCKKIVFYCMVGVFFAIMFVTLFEFDYIDHMVKFSHDEFGSKPVIVLKVLLKWFSYLSVLLITVQPFIKSQNVRNIMVCFCAPICLLNIVFFRTNVEMLQGVANAQQFGWRAILYSATLVTEMVIYLYIVFVLRHNFGFKNKKTFFLRFFAALIPLLVLMMPLHTPQQFFGETDLEIKFLTFGQHVYVASIFLLYFVLKNIFRNKTEEEREALIIILGIGMFYQFFIGFHSWKIPLNDLPLHMCNLATFLIPLALVTKSKSLFAFNLYVNVLGAFIAILVPDSAGIFSYKFLKFGYEHTLVFLVPFLAVALKVRPRGTKKDIFRAWAVFSVYFVLMIVLNVWFHNYSPFVNYFYLGDDFLAKYLSIMGWARQPKFQVSFAIGNLTFLMYPVFYVLMYVGFVGLMWLEYFIYQQVYAVTDVGEMRRTIYDHKKWEQKQLQLLFDGKTPNLPVNKLEGVMLRIANFSKKYEGSKTYAVHDFNLEVKEGEIFGFLGSNGSGKSTTIKSIIGVLPFSEGTIEIDGYNVATQPLQAKRIIGYVPDNHSVYENLTGVQYVSYVAELYNVPKEEKNRRMAELAESFNLTKAINNQIKTYSHGMKQKITIIAALVHDPKLWILDEPMTGLDPQSSFEVKELMKKHAEKGNTVFFSSHVIEVVEKICDRVAIINDGEMMGVYDMRELAANNQSLEQIFLEKTQKAQAELDASELAAKQPVAEESVSSKKPKKTKKKKDDEVK